MHGKVFGIVTKHKFSLFQAPSVMSGCSVATTSSASRTGGSVMEVRIAPTDQMNWSVARFTLNPDFHHPTTRKREATMRLTRMSQMNLEHVSHNSDLTNLLFTSFQNKN